MLNVFKKIGIISLGLIFSFNLALAQAGPNINFDNLNVDFSWDSGGAIVGVSGVVPWFPGLVNSSVVVKVEVSQAPFSDPGSYNGNFDLILTNNGSSQFSFNSYAQSLSQQFYTPGSTAYFLFRVDATVGSQPGYGYEVVPVQIPAQGGGGNGSSGGGGSGGNPSGSGGVNVGWDSPVLVNQDGVTTGSFSVSNIQNPNTLTALVLISDLSSFVNPIDALDLGSPPQNGVLDFSVSNYPAGTFFMPILVQSSTFSGLPFDPSSPGSVQIYFAGPDATSATGGGSGTTPTDGGLGGVTPDDGGAGGVTPDDGGPGIGPITLTSSINNPLGQDFDIIDFFQKLFANLVKIAIPILVLFMVYSGFKFVEAQGNEEKLKKAKQNFLYVIIGAFLILGAWTIATALRGTVDDLSQPIVFINQFINLI